MTVKAYTSLASFIDLLVDAVFVVDSDANVLFASSACERIFGYTPQEMTGKNMFDMMLPEDRERTRLSVTEVMSGRPQLHFENRYVRKDGQVVHIMWATRWSQTDQVRIGVARDITARKRAESRLAALYAISEAAHTTEDLPSLFQHLHQIIATLMPADNFSVVLYDEKTGQLSAPYQADEHECLQESLTASCEAGPLYAEIIRTGAALLLTPDSMATRKQSLPAVSGRQLLCWLGVPLASNKGIIGFLVLKSYPGGVRYSETDQELLQFVSMHIANAIERQRMQSRLQHMAHYDQLTGLPNRGLLYDRLKVALATARREQTGFCVFYLDLDNFKDVNDTLGHSVGDLLLQKVAERLTQCVRDSDTVARVGGDEFVIVLPGIRESAQAALVADKVCEAFRRPFVLEGHSLHIMPSLGSALYPEHGDSEEQLLKYADHAMYSGKKIRKRN